VHLFGFVIRMYLPVFDTYRCHYGNWTRLPITVIQVVIILQNSVHFLIAVQSDLLTARLHAASDVLLEKEARRMGHVRASKATQGPESFTWVSKVTNEQTRWTLREYITYLAS
jgi:hypothetical protein